MPRKTRSIVRLSSSGSKKSATAPKRTKTNISAKNNTQEDDFVFLDDSSSDIIPIPRPERCSSQRLSKEKTKSSSSSRTKKKVPSSNSQKKVPSSNTQKKVPSSNTQKKKPVVISLDVTYSSESDFNESDDECVEEIVNEEDPPKKKGTDLLSTILNNSDMIPRSTINYSDSSDNESIPEQNTKDDDEEINSSFSESDLTVDLYSIDHKAEKKKVLENTMKDLKNDIFEDPTLKVSPTRKSENSDASVLTPISKSQKRNSSNLKDNVLSPLNIDISQIELKKCSAIKQNKKTKLALDQLAAYSEKLQNNFKSKIGSQDDSFTDDVILIPEDDQLNSRLLLKVRWGTAYVRVPVKRNQHFATLYQHFAQLHNVSVSNVVLSYKDEIIPLDATPQDLKLSVADIIEGGIISNESMTNTIEKSDDIIELKVQTSNKREDIFTMRICKYDKLSTLMENYAKSRKTSVERLRFKFDGENILPNESPHDLDLEGGECIDVFELQ